MLEQLVLEQLVLEQLELEQLELEQLGLLHRPFFRFWVRETCTI